MIIQRYKESDLDIGNKGKSLIANVEGMKILNIVRIMKNGIYNGKIRLLLNKKGKINVFLNFMIIAFGQA